MRIASLLALALSLAACRSMDVRTHIPQNDALGRPKPIFDVEDEPGVWRWRVDTARLDGPIAAASDPHPGGLRVAVESAAALPGDADTHQAVESVSFEIPVGQGRWAGRPYASPACVDPIWVAAEVCVTWAIVLESRGTCAVLLEAVPVLTHPTGCRAVLADLRVRRVLALGETVVVGVDPGHPAADQASVLVGSPPGRPGRFAFRVRS